MPKPTIAHPRAPHQGEAASEELLDRRSALRRLGGIAAAAALAAGGAAQAQHMMPRTTGAGHGGGAPVQGAPSHGGSGHPERHDIPWQGGTCAFCDMTLASPGGPGGPASRERTYAQWAFEGEARHFESIGCAMSWAYVHYVFDGNGAALYVAPYDLGAVPGPDDLIAGADATFLWGERLPSSMSARLGAFRSPPDAAAYAAAADAASGLGRQHLLRLSLLADLAPLHVNNLVALLARQVG
jgi:hypothetical protein